MDSILEVMHTRQVRPHRRQRIGMTRRREWWIFINDPKRSGNGGRWGGRRLLQSDPTQPVGNQDYVVTKGGERDDADWGLTEAAALRQRYSGGGGTTARVS
jgi:hypothetical protein